MSKKALALVAVAGLALAGYASAASAGMLPDGVDVGLGANAKCARGLPEQAAEPAVEHRLQLCERHHRKVGLPPFRVDDASVQGRWVSFTQAPERGAILDYTSVGPFADAVVFTRIEVGEGNYTSTVRGPVWLARGDALQAVALNAPNAFLAVRNRGEEARTVTFTVADGIAVRVEETNGTSTAVLAKDGHEAAIRLRGNGTVSVDGEVVTATLEPGGAAIFAIQGYPRLLHHEMALMKRLAHGEDGARERMPERRGHGAPVAEAAPEDAGVLEA